MTLKTTNIRKQYFVPYAEMIECEEKECLLDTVSGFGEDPIGGGGNEEFAKGIWRYLGRRLCWIGWSF